MGCHTWIYRRVSSLSDNYKAKEVEKKIEAIKSYWIMTADKQKVIQRLKYTEKQYEKAKEEYRNQIKELRERGFDYLVELESDTALVKKIGGEYYWHTDFDYPFRVYGYPEVWFTDLEKLLDWLKHTDDKIGYYEEEGFREGYTLELEEEIRKYFKDNGEENIYVEFG